MLTTNANRKTKSPKEVQEYKDELKHRTEELVLKGFPETIVKLNNLLETPSFNKHLSDLSYHFTFGEETLSTNHHIERRTAKKRKSKISTIHESPRVVSVSNELITTNKEVVNLIEIVKPHIGKLIEDANLMKMWISFMVPKMEDGNNFGVSIQEEIISAVQLVESNANSFFEEISKYFESRGKLVSKILKYPFIKDYKRAVEELDQKEYLSLMLVMCEIRNRYCALHDVVIKNLDRIKRPRPTAANMY